MALEIFASGRDDPCWSPQAEVRRSESIPRRVLCCVRPFTQAAPMTRQAFKPSLPACPMIYWRYKPPNLGPGASRLLHHHSRNWGWDRTIVDIAKGTSVSGRSDCRIRRKGGYGILSYSAVMLAAWIT